MSLRLYFNFNLPGNIKSNESFTCIFPLERWYTYLESKLKFFLPIISVLWFLSLFNCNKYLSPHKLWGRVPLDATLCDQVCQGFPADRWFSPGTPVFSINKTDRHYKTEILLKVALNTITLTLLFICVCHYSRF